MKVSHRLEIYIELYKRKEHSFLGLTAKQEEALSLLRSGGAIDEIVFGGGAGGGKTWLACVWETFDCLSYPGIRTFIGRESLKRLRSTTFLTFKKVCKEYGIPDSYWNYNAQLDYITFSNGSRIDFLELRYLPRDPLFERYGSEEFTHGFIEEGGEIHFDAFDTLKSRVGRQRNKEYGIKKRILVSCNPKKNWLYKYFYKPWKDGVLKHTRAFIQALATDNVHIDDDYIEGLKNLNNKAKKERLLFGNWEYDDDPSALCDWDAICDLFTNDHIQGGKGYISADLAMKGRDKFIAGSWSGLVCNVAIDMAKSSATQIESKLRELKMINRIGNSCIIADVDGLGAYIEDYIKNIKAFHGGSRPKNKRLYGNKKDECGFKLGELINKRMIKINCSEAQEELIKEEISTCLKEGDIDGTKRQLIKKDKQKELLGRSPDYMDMLLMRMFFEISPKFVVKTS
tara:strand:+ start:4896 stop:6263 length:1368 start_codon:yes stop_codon:yes gene_type:complete